MRILTISNKKDRKFLHKKTREVNLKALDKKELKELIEKMKKIMRETDGVGLAANQVGLDKRFFVAEVTDDNEGRKKFYAVLNPEIIKKQGEELEMEEGCLSVPDTFGKVKRYEKVTLKGWDKNIRQLKIKAWGKLAHIFQHEIDHLNGILFTDKAKDIRKIETDRNS